MTMITALYGFFVYVFFLATFCYAIGFVGNFSFLPRTIDIGVDAPLAQALIVNLALLAVFAVQHSVMARRGFKRWWSRVVPEPMERSTYVLAASASLALLLWQWQPITDPVLWAVTDPIGRFTLQGIFWLGWVVLLISTFLINHFELFGLRQVWSNLRGKALPEPVFHTPLFYRHVRHPIYLGFILAFWAAPEMTAGHFLFAAGCTAYIFIGIWFEERDLVAQFGQRYVAYCKQAGMLFPKFGFRNRKDSA